MKLQISFDMPDLEKAIATASLVSPYADILEVGTLLIYHHGVKAVERFKQEFPKKIIFVLGKISNHNFEPFFFQSFFKNFYLGSFA